MKIFKYIIGILLIPVAVGFSKMFCLKLPDIGFIGTRLPFFLWGMVAYLLIHILFFKPNYLYTWGHEAIHVLATWLSGGHITSFNVSDKGGHATTSKTNFFIELSPYFVPVYTLLMILIMPFFEEWLREFGLLSPYIFCVGLTVGMHFIMTAESLKTKQPDLAKSGYAFSLMFIYIGNLLIIFFIFSLLFKGATFKEYFTGSVNSAKSIYIACWERLF